MATGNDRRVALITGITGQVSSSVKTSLVAIRITRCPFFFRSFSFDTNVSMCVSTSSCSLCLSVNRSSSVSLNVSYVFERREKVRELSRSTVFSVCCCRMVLIWQNFCWRKDTPFMALLDERVPLIPLAFSIFTKTQSAIVREK